MQAVGIVLWASAVGVSWGWQPMPDEPESYEYVLHVSPEIAASWRAGQAIPLVGEVPADLGPIRRIRVVLSAEEAPRRQATTRLKIAADDPILLTQMTTAADGRYGNPPAASSWNGANPAELADRAENAIDHAARELAADGRRAVDAGVNSLRRQAQELGPTAGQLFGSGGAAWNGGDGAAGAGQNALNNAAQQAVDPLRAGAQQLEQGVTNAADGLRARTQRLAEALQQPAANGGNPAYPAGPASPPAGALAAPPEWNAGAGARNPAPPPGNAVSQGWNGGGDFGQADPGQRTAPDQRLDRTIQPGDVARFGGPAPSLQRGEAAIPSAAAAATQPPGEFRGAATAPPGGAGRIPAGSPPADNRRPFYGDGPQLGGTNANSLAIPPLPNDPTVGGRTAAGVPGVVNAGGPTLEGHSLRQPANRPLEGPDSASLAAAPENAASSRSLPSEFDPERRQGATAPAEYSGSMASTPTSRLDPRAAFDQRFEPATAASTTGNALATLAAWVLLSGSVAGNFYLFWSYLDIRNKYRVIVRRSARSASSRLVGA